jgi:hypothetical protein
LSTSDDNGSTWSSATAITNYTSYSSRAEHPIVIQKTANQAYLIYDKIVGALHMNTSTTGWGSGDRIVDMHFDTATRMLYVVNATSSHIGVPHFSCITKVNVDTWTVEKHWDTTSAPAIHASFGWNGVMNWFGQRGSGPFAIAVGTFGVISMVNGDTDDVYNFVFHTDPSLGMVQNVTWTPAEGETLTNFGLRCAWVDETTNRLWVYGGYNYFYDRTIHIMYFDLTTLGSGPPYTFTDLWSEYNTYSQAQLSREPMMQVVPSMNYIIINHGTYYPGSSGFLVVYITAPTAAKWKDYTPTTTTPGYPYNGFHTFVYWNGKIYGGFYYNALYQPTQKGLCVVDLATDQVSFQQPPWLLDNDVYFTQMKVYNGNIYIASYGDGINIFNTDTFTWTQWTNTNVPGLSTSGIDTFMTIEYDSYYQMIFSGSWYGVPVGYGLNMSSEQGSIQQAHYSIGTYTTQWDWAAEDNLVQGYHDSEAVIAVDPSDYSLYSFWEHTVTSGESSIMWDKESATVDLSSYLLREPGVTIEWSIEGQPNKLEFTVSDGHLFDPYNTLSILAPILEKGKGLTVRMGDKVGGVSYWQVMGQFVVSETSVGIGANDFPEMKITAEDYRCLWATKHLVLSSLYDGAYPEDIIKDLVVDETSKTLSDISITNFDNRVTLKYQWVETGLMDALQQIVERFGYFLHVGVDDILTTKKVSDSNTVNHTYTDSTKLLNYSPDDSYSDFTNRIIVIGEEANFIEVTFPEERVAMFNASHRFNTGPKDYTIAYSEDYSRRCRNPRLVTLDSVSSFIFDLFGSHEEITDIDPNEKYCIVHVHTEYLLDYFLGLLVAIVVEAAIPDTVVIKTPSYNHVFHLPETTWPVGRIIQAGTITLAMMVLGSSGNFNYEIWAVPVGYVRRTVQSSESSDACNDVALQQKIGEIITQKVTNPLCQSEPACLTYASFLMMVAKCQRRRIKVTKVAHLQDEVGDTITLVHPFSGQSFSLFITNLRRTMVPAESGEFTDEIEGWYIP